MALTQVLFNSIYYITQEILPWVKFEGGVNENEKRLDGRTCHTLSINA
jgi:hypothetical protein